MSAYETLASAYDGLTSDIDYGKTLSFLEEILAKEGRKPQCVLDLACGTGSMSLLLAKKGYQVIGVDISEEMLTQAAYKAGTLQGNAPWFIRQSMDKLRLPMQADAVVCLLDSLNYLTEPEKCRKTFLSVYQALTPEGVFLFDINTPCKLRSMDGQVFLDENDESYCVWRGDFDTEENTLYYGIDLFRKKGKLWERSFEQHCEYAYDPDTLCRWLREAGFARVLRYGDCRMEAPTDTEQRIYFAAFKE